MPAWSPQRLIYACLAVVLYVSNIAGAFSYVLAIDQPNRISPAGSTEVFKGTITNDSGGNIAASDLFLNFSGFDPGVISLTQLLGSPDFVIPNGAASPSVDLFRLDFGASAIPGIAYFADVFVQDGSNPPDISKIVTVSVRTGRTGLPEPGTAALIGLALLVVLWCQAKLARQHPRN
jgi:hypothetical protein